MEIPGMKGKKKAVAAPDSRLVLAVRPTSELADMYPDWAELSLSPKFLGRVLELQKLCVENDLAHVADYAWWPEHWDNEEQHQIRGQQLIVDRREMWFLAHPKHAGFEIETHALKIETLQILIAGRKAPEGLRKRKGVYFYDSNDGEATDLIHRFEEHHANA